MEEKSRKIDLMMSFIFFVLSLIAAGFLFLKW